MAQQTSYNNNPPAALAGLIRRTEGTRVWSKIVDPSASGPVPLGMLCYFSASMSVPGLTLSTAASGSAGTIVPFPSGTISDNPLLDSETVGVAAWDPAQGADQITTVTVGTASYSGISKLMPVSVLRKGEIWCWSENAVTQFDDVYVRVTASGNFPAGMFRDGTAANCVKFSRGRWLMTLASGPGLCLMEVW
jgi:hypothetical protein